MGLDDKPVLERELSDNLRRHFPASVQKSIFVDRTGSAEFGCADRTVLCVQCLAADRMSGESVLSALRRLAPLHGGTVDPCADGVAFVTFLAPEQGLRAAVALQRLFGRVLLKIGLVTGRCWMARCTADGLSFDVLLGGERARAESLATRAAAGTVQLAPATYHAIGGSSCEQIGRGVMVAEFEDDVLTQVSLTLPPSRSADASTFAGLGLT